MKFGKSITTCIGKYADFDGRTSRSEFWWFQLFLVILSLVLSVSESVSDFFIIISFIANVATILPVFSVGARRLHDIGKSGWWQLLILTVIGIIPLIILLVFDSEQKDNKYGFFEGTAERTDWG